MKLIATAAALASLLAGHASLASAQDAECVAGAFAFTFSGACTAAAVVAAYADQVFDMPGATSKTCQIDAAADLTAKLAAAGLTDPAGLCGAVYSSQERVPFTDAAKRGDDLAFEKLFYDGRTDWQEEVETTSETADGTATSVLREDAAQVRTFFRGTAQGRRVAWPGSLSNFQSSVADDDGEPTCATNAAMCCWPKDRQANDNNGNCATPYDQNCVDNDPGDNTNLCFVDPARGNASTGYDAPDGVLVYPNDNGDGEGAVHCHGLAWSNDVNSPLSRYKANNLFFVSMYDHMHQRGYVQNIPGAPMCGCVEQMPTVSRSDCTQVDLTETVKITYDPDDAETPFTSKITHVDVDFNACQGINNRNNDLWAYMARLYYQGDVTPQQFGEAGRIITDNGCHEATKFQLNSIGMSVGYHHDAATWTKVAGRDALRDRDHHGRRAFAATLAADPDAGHHGLVYRVCATCRGTHQKIHYRRRTPVPAGFDLLDNLLYRNHDGGGNNVWGQDFSLHSTHEDAVADANPWECPNDSYDYNYNFYGRCSPDGTRISTERSRFNHGHDKKDVAYFANTAEESGLEEMPTIAVKGREYARGVALRDPVDGAIYMTGAGRDIWWVKDDFNYLPEDADGDRTVVVHVGSMSNPQPNQWSKAGIMFRAGPGPDAALYMVFLAGSRGICPIWRSARGAHMGGGNCVQSGATEAWLKVEKRTDAYASYVGSEAADGSVEWTLLHRAENLPAIAEADAYQVGLAVCSTRYYAMEVVFKDYQVDAYYFPSVAPTTSSYPTMANPGSVVGYDAVATQDSTCYGGVAARAIDGNTNGVWGHGSVTHTCNSHTPWLMIDLGREETRITNVVVHSRTDCCQWKLRNTDLELLDDAGSVVATQPFEGDKNVHEFRFGYAVGRYVRLKKKDYGSLNIAEVEVLGSYVAPSAAPSMTSSPTLADPNAITESAVATQVSTCYGGSASRAIDGNTDGIWWHGSTMHTCNSAAPWWKLDLGSDGVDVRKVIVYNRADCCQNRLGNTRLEILDAAGDVVASQPFQGAHGVYNFEFGKGQAVGRSVRINKQEYGVLNIAEVQVLQW